MSHAPLFTSGSSITAPYHFQAPLLAPLAAVSMHPPPASLKSVSAVSSDLRSEEMHRGALSLLLQAAALATPAQPQPRPRSLSPRVSADVQQLLTVEQQVQAHRQPVHWDSGSHVSRSHLERAQRFARTASPVSDEWEDALGPSTSPDTDAMMLRVLLNKMNAKSQQRPV